MGYECSEDGNVTCLLVSQHCPKSDNPELSVYTLVNITSRKVTRYLSESVTRQFQALPWQKGAKGRNYIEHYAKFVTVNAFSGLIIG